MRVFVPMPDEWDSGIDFAGVALVPYRAGLPLWKEPPIVEAAREHGDVAEAGRPLVKAA